MGVPAIAPGRGETNKQARGAFEREVAFDHWVRNKFCGFPTSRPLESGTVF